MTTIFSRPQCVDRGDISCKPLRWRHNGHDGVSNHQPHHCLLNRLFGCRSKKTSKLRVTGLCAGNSPGTGEFPAQMASNAENVSIWWRHHFKHQQRQAPVDSTSAVTSCHTSVLLPRQNGRHYVDHFSCMRTPLFRITFDWNLFLKAHRTVNYFRLRWCLRVKEAASHYLNQWWHCLLAHICVKRPQWVKYVSFYTDDLATRTYDIIWQDRLVSQSSDIITVILYWGRTDSSI